MSEKRFSIFDDDEVEDVWNELKGTIYCYDEEEAQRCENWLNNLHNQNQKLKEENERLKEKLNLTAFELVDEAISMGKAVEISEMNYHEFLEYRQKKGKPMELQR